MKTLLLKNANVVLPDREVPGGSVLIEEGRIVSLEGNQADEVLDLAGTTLLPGFIDVHIHGAVGVDVMEATPTGLREVSS
jgi:N-acetylglucosamine-6-phosphate deacetylase